MKQHIFTKGGVLLAVMLGFLTFFACRQDQFHLFYMMILLLSCRTNLIFPKMKKVISLLILIFYLTNIQAQKFDSIADSLREIGVKKIVTIEIEEVDSIHFFKPKEKSKLNFPLWLAAHKYKEDGTSKNTYVGRLIDVFARMIETPPAYIKTIGIVPNVYLRCTVGFRKLECNNGHISNVINFLERYYNCHLEKIQDSLDVFIIHKEYPEKLSLSEREGKQTVWLDLDGRWICQQYISQLEGQDIATLTSRMSYIYGEIFVLSQEDKSDSNSYYILEENKENKSIESAYKEMKDNGLRLTKEKRVIDFYRLSFF